MAVTDARRAEFAAFQAERAATLRKWVDALHGPAECAEPRCRRAKACRGRAPDMCLRRVLRATFSEQGMQRLGVAMRAQAGGADSDAAWREGFGGDEVPDDCLAPED